MTDNSNVNYSTNNFLSDNNSEHLHQQSDHQLQQSHEMIKINNPSKSPSTSSNNVSSTSATINIHQININQHGDIIPDGFSSSIADDNNIHNTDVHGMEMAGPNRDIIHQSRSLTSNTPSSKFTISNGINQQKQQSAHDNQTVKQEYEDDDYGVGGSGVLDDGGGGTTNTSEKYNMLTQASMNFLAANTPASIAHKNSGPDEFPTNKILGRLISKDNILLITEPVIEIGRNSSKSTVHFNVGRNSFVSRKHLEIHFKNNEFYLICLSKNGVVVDDVFTRKCFEQIILPKSCNFRFPSTNIRIAFENLLDENLEPNNKLTTQNIKNVENSNVIYKIPLKISIPEERKSPYPSPTGTISAANSCPTSPRQGFHDYSSYSNSSHNNNNNNFQNDMFHPPSTSYGEHEKPPYSYAQLIVQSISASPEKQLTLSGIYSFISKNYPYYRTGANKGWQNSIRHNLSLNRYFIKVPRSQDEPGKGSFWRIDPTSEMKLIDQSYRKRRQRGSQCFRSPFGMPRSAPVSPSHIDLLLHFVDNSRENSPLHDITMQSAPGSPGHYHNNFGDNNIIEETANSQGPSYNPTPYNYNCSSSMKREHDVDAYEESEEYGADEYDNIKRPKITND